MKAQESQTRDLLFEEFGEVDFGVFYDSDKKSLEDSIWAALDDSKTWGEFVSCIPKAQLEAIMEWKGCCYVDGDEILFAFDKEFEAKVRANDPDVEDCVIRAEDPFSSESVPGVCDGDYPPFLPPEQDDFLPEDFCEKYGQRHMSGVSGSWWAFPVDRIEEMSEELRSRGFSVDVWL